MKIFIHLLNAASIANSNTTPITATCSIICVAEHTVAIAHRLPTIVINIENVRHTATIVRS